MSGLKYTSLPSTQEITKSPLEFEPIVGYYCPSVDKSSFTLKLSPNGTPKLLYFSA